MTAVVLPSNCNFYFHLHAARVWDSFWSDVLASEKYIQ